jgi:hypothetical protein
MNQYPSDPPELLFINVLAYRKKLIHANCSFSPFYKRYSQTVEVEIFTKKYQVFLKRMILLKSQVEPFSFDMFDYLF